MIRLEVKDFGPIIEGAVDLKPLTIFVGPNNSGKSYMAVMIYALFNTAQSSAYLRDGRIPYEVARDLVPELTNWLGGHNNQLVDSPEVRIPYNSLSRQAVEAFQGIAQDWGNSFIAWLELELSRSFGSELKSLARLGSSKPGFSITLSQDHPKWHLGLTSQDNRFNSTTQSELPFSLRKIYISPFLRSNPQLVAREGYIPVAGEDFIAALSFSFYQHIPTRTYYLPAARSGILQGHKLLTSAIVRRSPLAGIEPLETARLSGVVADFISGLQELDSDSRNELYEIAVFLEHSLAKGRIFVEAAKVEYPEIYYGTDEERFLIHQTSSMVSELAPLVLFLKHTVHPGDLLIIEEPESHLHPANQRKLAWAIVKMIRKGLRVMVTTHSDYFLSQLSNFVRLSELPKYRVRQGYGEEDYLSAEEVSCYLFDVDENKGGSVVHPLEVSNEGIAEEQLSDVAESLYDELVTLDRARID